MSFRKWETKRTFIEARVSLPASNHEVRQALDWIESERDGWGTEKISVELDDDAIVFTFPGEVVSVGADR